MQQAVYVRIVDNEGDDFERRINALIAAELQTGAYLRQIKLANFYSRDCGHYVEAYLLFGKKKQTPA
ncbi:MAG: hypothetical protein IJQ16_07475 [Selenomonadaceae bacterium]|nr:hypothetical protein [Selenomonadaceae bacterium]